MFDYSVAQNPVAIPQNSKGLVITVQSGGYNMTGLTATLLMQPQENSGPGTTVPLTLVVSGDGLSGSYTTVGNEFSVAGFYAAQLKVTNASNILLYSVAYDRQFSVQPVLG